MPAPQERDLNKATEDFKNWLINEKDQDASIIVEVLGGPENTGFSNETLSFNVTQGAETTGYVLRFHPSGFLVFPEYDIEKQFLIMKELSNFGVKVPEVVWYEPSEKFLDSPFYVMKMCEGEAPSDNPPFHSEGWLADSSEEVRRKVWMGWVEQMSMIHKVSVDSNFDFLSSGKESRPLDDDLSYYKNLLEKQTTKKMICTNPDLIVDRGNIRELCAGSVAMVFEKMGGEVIYFGKPHAEVYNQSIDNVGKKVLAIGDNLNTDIKGANLLNYHSLLVCNGIHKEEIHKKGVGEVSKEYEAIVNFTQTELKW